MVGVGLVYRFSNDLKENFLTQNIKNKNTPKNLSVPSSNTNQNKDSELSKSKNLINKGEILSLPKENIIKKSEVLLSVTSQIKEKAISINTFVKKQVVKKNNSLINHTEKN